MVSDSSFGFRVRVKTMLEQPLVTLNLDQMNLLLLWIHVNISNWSPKNIKCLESFVTIISSEYILTN